MPVKVMGSEELVKALKRGGQRLANELGNAMHRGAQAIKSNVQRTKLRGQVLNQRGPHLVNTIQAKRKSKFVAAVGTNVVYAPVHEFGARMPERFVAPKRKQALHWVQDGQDRFSKGHTIPAFNMPARPFMKPAMEEEEDQIRDEAMKIIRKALDND